MSKMRVLAFGEELRLRAARRVATCQGAEVALEPDPARIVERASEVRPSVVLFDRDHAGPAALGLLRGVVEAVPRAHVVVLAHPSPPPDISALLAEPWFHHLLALESPWFMEELAGTLARFGDADLFGLASYLPWGSRVVTHRVTSSDEKSAIFDRIETFMLAIGVGGRVVQRLQAVADEMLMNAIYDAPLDADGRHKYAALSRETRIVLEPDEQPVFRFGSDGRKFAVSMTDPFGGLTRETFTRYIAKGLRRGADQIDRKEGGAGLGLFLLFDSLHTYNVHRVPGRCTEVVGLLDIRGSFRDVVNTPKSINFFEREGR